ncbi:MAG: periplasmic heavy metal sensor [Verrucomicrobiales bacterium]|nr:periplasmic heavy metal sensor [Verrucomicrobiales bacterium]
MRRGLLILGLSLAGGIIAYCCVYFAGTTTAREWRRSAQPELAWLKHEFSLNDAEFSRIAQLHQAYLPQCKERCRQIEELNGKLTNAISSAAQMTAEIEKLLDERGKMRAQCQAEMLKHFLEVSRTMPSAQGKRYLAWVQTQTCLNEQAMNHGPRGNLSHGQ